MIICKYRDGSSIRVYKTKQHRKTAISKLTKMGHVCFEMANFKNHYSLKVLDKVNGWHQHNLLLKNTGMKLENLINFLHM